MAVIPDNTESEGSSDDRVYISTWTIASGDTCEPVFKPATRDRCVQVFGTFGGATVTIEGSNEVDHYSALKELLGGAASFTTAGIKQLLEIPLRVKPVISGGGATTSLTVIIVQRRGFR